MRTEVDRMRRLLVACAERSSLCLAGDVIFERDRSTFRIGRTKVEVTLQDGVEAIWNVRHLYEVPDVRGGGTRVRATNVATLPVGLESTVAKTAILKAIELNLDSVVDALAEV